MAGATPDHSTVITNFVNMVYNQLKDSTCQIYPNNVQYKWKMLDGSKKNSYTGRGPKYYLIDTVAFENKEGLHLVHFQHIKIDSEQLFDGID